MVHLITYQTQKNDPLYKLFGGILVMTKTHCPFGFTVLDISKPIMYHFHYHYAIVNTVYSC